MSKLINKQELNEVLSVSHAEILDGVYPLQTPEDKGWEDFRDQCRRQMKRPIELRLKYGFAKRTAPTGSTKVRVFDSTAEYREWCEKNFPDYMGFRRVAR